MSTAVLSAGQLHVHRKHKVTDCSTWVCRECFDETVTKQLTVTLLEVFDIFLRVDLFFLVGLCSLNLLSCFDWDFTLSIFLWQNDWSPLRKGKDSLWGISVLLLQVLFFSTHRTLGISLGNHIPSQSLSWCGSFQYSEPGSATNSSHLPLSFLNYFCSCWKGL